MKITDLQTFIVGNPWKNWVFLKLHTDSDIYGVGEATAHRWAKMAEAGVLEMRRYYLDRDPFSIEEINEEFSKISAPSFVKAAVDMACWDIMGKALDQPVYQLLGGRFRDRVPAYANGWYQVDRTPKAFDPGWYVEPVRSPQTDDLASAWIWLRKKWRSTRTTSPIFWTFSTKAAGKKEICNLYLDPKYFVDCGREAA